ncbi:hypothetical protein PABG_01021 [Paracoccidioides brasiliensis Pb03]|nr:hypothetical protein PABG_01021 [Paracoccidioides brasiliensis Pb03]
MFLYIPLQRLANLQTAVGMLDDLLPPCVVKPHSNTRSITTDRPTPKRAKQPNLHVRRFHAHTLEIFHTHPRTQRPFNWAPKVAKLDLQAAGLFAAGFVLYIPLLGSSDP